MRAGTDVFDAANRLAAMRVERIARRHRRQIQPRSGEPDEDIPPTFSTSSIVALVLDAAVHDPVGLPASRSITMARRLRDGLLRRTARGEQYLVDDVNHAVRSVYVRRDNLRVGDLRLPLFNRQREGCALQSLHGLASGEVGRVQASGQDVELQDGGKLRLVFGLQEILDGLQYPTRRTVFARRPDGTPDLDLNAVTIALSDYALF